MTLDRIRPTVFQITLHTYELAALMSAARWVAEGAEGDLPDEAVEQLQDVLERYDAERERLHMSDSN